jgi:hypothetical protein
LWRRQNFKRRFCLPVCRQTARVRPRPTSCCYAASPRHPSYFGASFDSLQSLKTGGPSCAEFILYKVEWEPASPIKRKEKLLSNIHQHFCLFFKKPEQPATPKDIPSYRQNDFCPFGVSVALMNIPIFQAPAHPTVTVWRLQSPSVISASPFVRLLIPSIVNSLNNIS